MTIAFLPWPTSSCVGRTMVHQPSFAIVLKRTQSNIFGHNGHADLYNPAPKGRSSCEPRIESPQKKRRKICVAHANHQTSHDRGCTRWLPNARICREREIPSNVTLHPTQSDRKQGAKGRKSHSPHGLIRTAAVSAQSSCLGCSTRGHRARSRCWSRAPMDAAWMGLSPQFCSERQP